MRLGHRQVDVADDNLGGRIAEQLLSSLVPMHDPAVSVDVDHRADAHVAIRAQSPSSRTIPLGVPLHGGFVKVGSETVNEEFSMSFRKKKSARDQLEDRLDDLLTQADDLRQEIADRAPEVRDRLKERLEAGAAEVRDRWPDVRDEVLDRVPEMKPETYDKLPNGVKDRMPKQVKPKKKRLRKLAVVGLVAGGGAAAFAALRRQGSGPAHPSPPPFDAPTKPQAQAQPAPKAPPTAGDVVDKGPGPKP